MLLVIGAFLIISAATSSPLSAQDSALPDSPDASLYVRDDEPVQKNGQGQNLPSATFAITTEDSTWKWMKGPLSIEALHFVDEDHGWGVGYYGVVIHTEDQGQTWVGQLSGTESHLFDVQFVDTNTGWAIGADGAIIHTEDGGNTWSQQASPVSSDLEDIFFLNGQIGWIGLPAGVLKTTDSGQNWTITGSGLSWQIRDIQFFDPNNGVAVGNDGTLGDDGWVYITADGGDSWSRAETDDWNSFGHAAVLHFADETFGIAAANFVGTSLFKSTDAGANWTPYGSGNFQFFQPHTIHLLDHQYGWALNRDTLMRTSDGGQTWNELGDGGSDIQFLTFTDGYMAGYGGIDFSTTGGATWNTPDSFISGQLVDIEFVNDTVVSSSNGWVIESGEILHSTDGGVTWSLQHEAQSTLNRIHAIDKQFAWVVGDRGLILATTNGGNSWRPQSAVTDYHIYDVHFADRNNGWIVGEEPVGWEYRSGKVWKTIDGGQSWRLVGYFESQYPNERGKFGVDFPSINVGYIVGNEGQGGSIHKTTDGGESWELILGNGTYPQLNKVDFINDREGWVVGNAGTVLHTEDGGETWQLQPTGFTDNMHDVIFLNSALGYVVGNYSVLKTTDGGETWMKENLQGDNSFVAGIAIPNPYQAWAISSGGIYSYSDPTTPEPRSIYLPLIVRN